MTKLRIAQSLGRTSETMIRIIDLAVRSPFPRRCYFSCKAVSIVGVIVSFLQLGSAIR